MTLPAIHTPQMATLYAAVRAEFTAEFASGAISSWGIYNCRQKNNNPANPYSEHSWGNGEDYRILPVSGPAGDALKAWAVAHPGLVSESFWKVPLHFDHVHLTAAPRMNPDNNQIPPCAGGGQEPMTLLPLTEGTDSQDVGLLQRRLNYAFGAGLSIDNTYGPSTKAAVLANLVAGDGDGSAVRHFHWDRLDKAWTLKMIADNPGAQLPPLKVTKTSVVKSVEYDV